MAIILENTETKETREMKSGEMFSAPWHVKGTVANEQRSQAKNALKAELATMASEFGVPMAGLLSGARWLLGKDCPFCEVGGEFLALLQNGAIDRAQAKDLICQVLNAKDQKDYAALAALKGTLERLRNQSDPVSGKTRAAD